MSARVSLIIPHKHSYQQLNNLCQGISSWKKYPDEIIIIDSSKKKIILDKNFSKFCDINNIVLKLIYAENLYPGQARNKGILLSSNPVIAFLDVNTLPSNSWLDSGLKLLEINECQGVWGSTKYISTNHKEKIIRASTYGSLPLKTLPGSILRKEVFNKCGLLLESVRAGEDKDWMSRVNIHKIKMSENKEVLSYVGLSEITYLNVIKKWYRNYLSASELTYIKSHKDWYFYSLSIFAIIFAFNWNWLIAEKKILIYSESLFYIPHITKISITMIVVIYVIFRGLYLPIKKGISLFFLLPINFIIVSIFSTILDIIKMFSFLQAKLYK